MLPSWGALYTQSLCRSVKSFFRAVGLADVRITYIRGRPGVPRKEEEDSMKRKIALFLVLALLGGMIGDEAGKSLVPRVFKVSCVFVQHEQPAFFRAGTGVQQPAFGVKLP